MSVLRLASRVSTRTSVRATPSLARSYVARELMPDVPSNVGQTATSKGFGQREEALEGQYIHNREEEQRKRAREKAQKEQAEQDKSKSK